MRIPICLRGEKAASMHFVKVRWARDSVLVSHSLEGESQESSVMGGYLDVNVSREQTSPLCESARGSASA